MSQSLILRAVLGVLLGSATLGGLAPLAPPSWAQETPHPGGNAVVNGTDGTGLIVRSGPGLGEGARTSLAEGTRVQVLEGPVDVDGHQWVRVSSAVGTGWASARYLMAAVERVALAASGALERAGVLERSSGLSGRAVPMRIVGYNVPATAAPRTSMGTVPRWGTVAVDPRVIPLGSRLLIEGFDGVVFIAEDTGSAVVGNIVDVWFDDRASAARFGTQTRTVTILGQ